MNNPWMKFKLQPWRQLSLTALLTTFVAVVFDTLLLFALIESASFLQWVNLVYQSPLGLIIPLAAVLGFGALGVYLCEKTQPQVVLNTSSLWALVLCLIIGLWLKTLLPNLLIGFSYNSLIALILGVFWKGRPYWRHWR